MYDYVMKNKHIEEKIGHIGDILYSLKKDGFYGGMEETFIASEML